MPSTATITAFYTFTANTKARASLVNANFDIFRGHLLPLSPSTQTAINNTYDLGSSEYSFRKGYIGELNIGATSTSWKIKDATTTGSGDLIFFKNNVEAYRVPSSFGETVSASIGQLASSTGMTATTTYFNTTAVQNIIGSTISIQTMGRPVSLFCDAIDALTGTGAYISASMFTTIGSYVSVPVLLYRDSVLIKSILVGYSFMHTTNNIASFRYMPSSISFLDTPPSGTYVYELRLGSQGFAFNCSCAYLKFKAIELR